MPQHTAGHRCTTAGDTCARLVTDLLLSHPEVWLLQNHHNKGLPKQQYPKAEVLRDLIRLPLHITEYSTKSETNLKKRLQESRSKAKGNCTFLQDSAASRTGSERAQLLTLSLEKFHERFKLCVDENHHVQGAELRSWSLNLRNPRSCRKVTVFQTEPVQTLHARLLFSRLSPSAFLS